MFLSNLFLHDYKYSVKYLRKNSWKHKYIHNHKDYSEYLVYND